MKQILLARIIKNTSLYISISIIVAVLASPLFSFSPSSAKTRLTQENISLQSMTAMQASEGDDTYFNPDNYDIVEYVRDESKLMNRGDITSDSDLLLGSAIEESSSQSIQVPPDMTFEDDYTEIFVSSTILNMRKLPSTDSDIIHTYKLADSILRTGIGKEWDRVVDDKGTIGYMKKEFVADTMPTPSPKPTKAPAAKKPAYSSTPAKANTLGGSIAKESLKYLGIRYRYGGSAPSKGFDCTGLTTFIFNRYGISTPRSSYSYASAGIKIPYSQIAPGDVIAWSGSRRGTSIGHVGIYIGNGTMVHASLSNGICKVSVDQYKRWGYKLISVHRFIKK